jgi:hypothetical protein
VSVIRIISPFHAKKNAPVSLAIPSREIGAFPKWRDLYITICTGIATFCLHPCYGVTYIAILRRDAHTRLSQPCGELQESVRVRKALDEILTAAQEIPREKIPRLLGDIEEIRATAAARLAAPPGETKPDGLLDVHATALRLGVSASWLYKNHAQFAFTTHVGGKLLFSVSGLEKYLAAKSK